MNAFQDKKVLKEIINRISKDNSNLRLHDCSDNSNIVIDKKLLAIIKIYYEDKLNSKLINR